VHGLSAEASGPVLTVPGAPLAVHVMAKPTGAVCNLDCEYCFFLSKEMLYPGSRFRMAAGLQETYIRQLLEAHARAPEVVATTPSGEPGLHYLCPGYKAFFHHVAGPMDAMSALLRAGRAPAELMAAYAAQDARRGRNDPCTCGSGRKWKRCHGTPAHATAV
jgi:sulfatase maturation enzyme AslB (radical SAM superfamily)